MNVVIFDVDGTLLTGRRSSEALFIRHLLRRGIVGPRQIGAAAGFLARHGLRHGRHAFRKNKAYLAGLELAVVAEIAESFTREELEPILDRALIRRMDDHRAKGARIALLTGTPDFLTLPLARLVGADDWRGARYALDNGIFLAAPPVRHPLGRDKIHAAESLCQAAGSSLAEATAYADSIHDLPLMTAVRRAVAVRPDHHLMAEAKGRGWEIMGAGPEEETPIPQGRATRA
jgi:HAD superfamily hydrolase (TIGR01490 family)